MLTSALQPGEFVYRRAEHRCAVCAAPAPIVLHVGTGGNYREVFVCGEHDAPVGDVAAPRQQPPAAREDGGEDAA